jgi:predicted TIM-barrel fold metal-dependent hydrolase
MVNGLTNGAFLDDKRFWPIFERAQVLDVPLYMHPAIPHPAVIEAY